MFDIGFSEMIIIAVVALIVIGPERLPKVARTAGHLFGRLQRYVNDVKADISREMELEELRKLRSQFEDAARSVEQSVNEVGKEVQGVGNELSRSIETAGAEAAPTQATQAPQGPGAAPEPAPSAVPASLPPLEEPGRPPAGGGPTATTGTAKA